MWKPSKQYNLFPLCPLLDKTFIFFASTIYKFYCTNNKIQETNIGIQAEISEKQSSQQIRAFTSMTSSYPKENKFLSHPILYSSTVLVLKACTITSQPLFLTSVAAGIKSVCH